ncbi:hypothetical protein [Pseudonocardia kunmingensis]|uniref:hypothetical protein n=1 Tax=Pseudonocardia kunmingensis TaxID=630975 RepID=UPI001151FB35|nr:hypothetical protein [Pseudonocardia kunmingensis]
MIQRHVVVERHVGDRRARAGRQADLDTVAPLPGYERLPQCILDELAQGPTRVRGQHLGLDDQRVVQLQKQVGLVTRAGVVATFVLGPARVEGAVCGPD